MRPLLGRLLATALFLGASPAHADGVLARCIDDATSAMAARGARRAGDAIVAFMQEGQTRSVPITLEAAGCVGVLAVGHRRVHDIDLVLQTDTGMALAQDVEVDAHPYLRFCGAAGLRLIATLQMYKGQGEVRIVRFTDAPAALPDLDRTLGGCFAGGGGMRRPSGEVGPAPPGRPLAESVAETERELAGLGYRPQGVEERGTLEAPARDAHVLQLGAGRCYAVIAIGDAHVTDLDLFVRGPTGAEIARDTSRGAKAVARFCPEHPTVSAEVRMFQGAGEYRLRAFLLDEPAPDARPVGVSGFARVGLAEATARMRAHGMAPRPVAWGLIGPGQALPMPVRLEAGKCYAFAGVPSPEIAGGDLDLILLDDEDALLGWDVGPGNVPLVFHCATRTGVHRIVGRVYDAAGRYLVLLGEEP